MDVHQNIFEVYTLMPVQDDRHFADTFEIRFLVHFLEKEVSYFNSNVTETWP